MTETSLETKKQYLAAIEELAAKLRAEVEGLELAGAMRQHRTASTATLSPPLRHAEHADAEAVETPDRDPRKVAYERISELEKERNSLARLLKAAEASMRVNYDHLMEERQRVERLVAILQERDEQVEELNARIERMLREADDLDEQYLRYKAEAEQANRETANAGLQMLKLEGLVAERNDELQGLNSHIVELNGRIVELEAALTDAQRGIARRDATIEHAAKRLNAIAHAADPTAEWP